MSDDRASLIRLSRVVHQTLLMLRDVPGSATPPLGQMILEMTALRDDLGDDELTDGLPGPRFFAESTAETRPAAKTRTPPRAVVLDDLIEVNSRELRGE